MAVLSSVWHNESPWEWADKHGSLPNTNILVDTGVAYNGLFREGAVYVEGMLYGACSGLPWPSYWRWAFWKELQTC